MSVNIKSFKYFVKLANLHYLLQLLIHTWNILTRIYFHARPNINIARKRATVALSNQQPIQWHAKIWHALERFAWPIQSQDVWLDLSVLSISTAFIPDVGLNCKQDLAFAFLLPCLNFERKILNSTEKKYINASNDKMNGVMKISL